ncbi:MAG: accessory Sec system protein Asp3 [Lachnospiraceae bacterium]|jgi:accessory secretory protein Asp3|nr:accessory Sec system protein Asp3 [Lachnospiraceae bacterium]
MAGAKWTIYWNEYSADTYLYGSEIQYHKKDDVQFRNLLMPPGTVIKQWYSRTNFQAQKIEPALPMIDGERSYRITVKIDTLPRENWLVRLVFYDRYEEEAGSLVLRDSVTQFRCPLKTYSYAMQLINGGMTKFRYHFIIIQELEYGTEERIAKTE